MNKKLDSTLPGVRLLWIYALCDTTQLFNWMH